MEREFPFIQQFIVYYFIALGVLIGGCLLGALGAFLVGQPPLTIMHRLSQSLRIWALVAAIGGTFDTFYSFERGLFQGATSDVVRQILFIMAAMGGAQTGTLLIEWFTRDGI